MFLHSLVLLSLLAFQSCTTIHYLSEDNVYVMKQPKLPVGESLNDESAYSTFKFRKNCDSEIDAYYIEDNFLLENYYSNQFYWLQFMSFSSNVYTPFYNNSLYTSPWAMFGYGNYWNSPYNCNFYDPYSGFYYGNPWNNCIYFNNWYNSNNWGNNDLSAGNNLNNSQFSSNYHEGPRGSFSGFTNQKNRMSSVSIKSVSPQLGNMVNYRPTNFKINDENENFSSVNKDLFKNYGNAEYGRITQNGYYPKHARENNIGIQIESIPNANHGSIRSSGNFDSSPRISTGDNNQINRGSSTPSQRPNNTRSTNSVRRN